MKIALVTFSPLGLKVAEKIRAAIPEAAMYLHDVAGDAEGAVKFSSIMESAGGLFGGYEGIVFIGPCGVAVRAFAPHVKSKLSDPAIVVMDVGARHAISLLSGHEGGANELAVRVANITGAEPCVTTTTEAEKDMIAGIGCKRGTEAGRIIEALKTALGEADVDISRVRTLASADVKADEAGLLSAAEELGLPVRFIPSEVIRTFAGAFERSEFVMEKVGLPAVAEPCALLAGRRTSLILKKRKFNGITVALAVESFT